MANVHAKQLLVVEVEGGCRAVRQQEKAAPHLHVLVDTMHVAKRRPKPKQEHHYHAHWYAVQRRRLQDCLAAPDNAHHTTSIEHIGWKQTARVVEVLKLEEAVSGPFTSSCVTKGVLCARGVDSWQAHGQAERPVLLRVAALHDTKAR